MPKINVSDDFFIRTTDPEHGEGPGGHHPGQRQRLRLRGPLRGLVLPALRRLQDRVRDRRGQHLPDPRDPARAGEGGELVLQALGAFQERLEQLYEERPDFVIPDFRRNEAVSFIKQGLQDVSLSRPKLSWGVPLPWDPEPGDLRLVRRAAQLRHRAHLRARGEDLTERFWPPDLHVMAKDILKFHAVYWPALLWAADMSCRSGW